MIDLKKLLPCPYCGSKEYKIIERGVCSGHNDNGTETTLLCLGCETLTTHKNYYNWFEPEKYNKRIK